MEHDCTSGESHSYAEQPSLFSLAQVSSMLGIFRGKTLCWQAQLSLLVRLLSTGTQATRPFRHFRPSGDDNVLRL